MPTLPILTESKVRSALAECKDPELGIDVVSLGLIYRIAIDGTRVAITMTLTTPGCPLLPYFEVELVDQVKRKTGASQVSIQLTFDPPWHPGLMNQDAKSQLQMLRS